MPEAISNFAAKVKKANAIGSQELRLTTKEASDLMAEVMLVLNDSVVISKKLSDTEKLIGKQIDVDGGYFAKKS